MVKQAKCARDHAICNKGVELSLDAGNRKAAHLDPVDLHLLTQLNEEPRFGTLLRPRPMLAHVFLNDGAATGIAARLQLVVDTLCGPLARHLVSEPRGDLRLVQLERNAF